MLPNLFFLGFPKCGSTTFYALLSRQHWVNTSKSQESRIFVFDEESERQLHLQELDEHQYSEKRPYTLNANPLAIYSNKALKRIFNNVEAPKMIVCIRDPIRRLRSHYNHALSLFSENRSVDEIIDSEINLPPSLSEGFNGSYRNREYLAFSRYEVYIENLLDFYDSEKVLFLSFEKAFDPSTGPDYIKEKIESYLGVDLTMYEIHENPTSPPRIEINEKPHVQKIGANGKGEFLEIECENSLTLKGARYGPNHKTFTNLSQQTLSFFRKAAGCSFVDESYLQDRLTRYYEKTYAYLDKMGIKC